MGGWVYLVGRKDDLSLLGVRQLKLQPRRVSFFRTGLPDQVLFGEVGGWVIG